MSDPIASPIGRLDTLPTVDPKDVLKDTPLTEANVTEAEYMLNTILSFNAGRPWEVMSTQGRLARLSASHKAEILTVTKERDVAMTQAFVTTLEELKVAVAEAEAVIDATPGTK